MVCSGTLCAGALDTKTAHRADNITTEVLMVLDLLNLLFRFFLPNNFQCKLNLPRRGLRRSDAAESGNRLPCRADDLERAAALICGQRRRRKVGAIQRVEKFGAE